MPEKFEPSRNSGLVQVRYEIYTSPEGLLPDERELLTQARAAMEYAYAPYSNFHVGAALRLKDGNIIIGSNQENASYGLTICAERTALVTAGSHGHGDQIVGIAIIGTGRDHSTTEPVLPCGACRQWLNEAEQRAGNPITIIVSGNEGDIWKFDGITPLLPFGFGPRDLGLVNNQS
jgi:cytidine deaminase